MTREEEIINEATGSYPHDNDCFLAFIKGGKYADRTMLDRACEWLSIYYPNIDRMGIDEFITAFRQAMEGGAE